MIELCIAGAVALTSYYKYINKNTIANKKLKKDMSNKWNLCMKYANIKNSNDESFQIIEIFPKHYGCDCIISIPFGLNAKKIFENLPMIEQNFSCNVYVNISSKGNTIYARFVLYPNELTEIDNIKCSWDKIMMSHKDMYNQDFKTFTIKKIIPQDKYGYDITLSIPFGKSITNIQSIQEIIETNLKCRTYIDDPINNTIFLKLITKEFDDNLQFVPIKVTSTQLYLGMTYDYRPVIVDLKNLAHMLYTGMNGTGKTVCLLTALTNLIYYNTDEHWELYMSMISSKKDLRIFRNVKQCKYYADNLNDAYKLLKYLHKQMECRNKLFDSDENNCIVNIYEWNDKHPKEKLKDIIFATDEISYFMPDGFDNKVDTELKSQCLSIFLRLLKEGRSCGIHILGSLQRCDQESLSPRMKAQFGIKVVFYQPNTASSLVVLDTNEATKLKKKREAIVDADERYLMKTLYITPDMIKQYISKSIEINHKYIDLDNTGNIQKETNKSNKLLKKSKNNQIAKKKCAIYSFPAFANNKKRR